MGKDRTGEGKKKGEIDGKLLQHVQREKKLQKKTALTRFKEICSNY